MSRSPYDGDGARCFRISSLAKKDGPAPGIVVVADQRAVRQEKDRIGILKTYRAGITQ